MCTCIDETDIALCPECTEDLIADIDYSVDDEFHPNYDDEDVYSDEDIRALMLGY